MRWWNAPPHGPQALVPPPLTPPDVTGLWAWYKADSESYADNDLVATATDRSGNGRNATAQTNLTPVFKTNVVNGHPVYRFDGVDDVFNLPSMAALTAGTMFVVIKIDADPPPGSVQSGCWFTGDNSLAYHFPYTDGVIYDGWGSTARKTTVDPAPSLTQFHNYCVRSAANDWANYLDGEELFSTTTNTTSWTSAPLLGRSAFGLNLDGDIAEVIIYSTAVSASNRQGLETYLRTKYGLA